MPTKRRRHAITETPPVKEALDELRRALGDEPVQLGELVILGAREKTAQLRKDRDRAAAARRRIAERILAGDIPVDPAAAAEELERPPWFESIWLAPRGSL